MSDTAQLRQLLLDRSVRYGKFTLASGRESTIYVDVRLTSMSPQGMVAIGANALARINAADWNPDSVGGLTMGADPVSFAISFQSAGTTKPIRAFTVRKEAKAHGVNKLIEGPFNEGDAVVVTEDVITTGGSALKAIDAVEKAGGIIRGVLAVVDRQEGGREAILERGYQVIALTQLSDLKQT